MQKNLLALSRFVGILAFLILVGPALDGASLARADILHGVGVMGDSASIVASFKWPVQLQTDRGLNFGGTGLPYDHAVGGATSTSVLSGGQNTQMAADVTAGNVTLGLFLIGNNDYAGVASNIANGSFSGAALVNFQNTVASNIETATNSALTAGIQGFLLASVPDLTFEPLAASIAANPAQKALVENSISAVNAQLLSYTAAHHIGYVDFYGFANSLGPVTSITVGGVPISLVNTGSDPHDFFLDGVHPGIVGNAIIGNLWMAAINKEYGTSLTLFTDQQILTLAGLSGYTGETFSNVVPWQNFVIVPEPSSVVLAALGALMLLVRSVVWRRRQARH
jgi:hypothetical protein